MTKAPEQIWAFLTNDADDPGHMFGSCWTRERDAHEPYIRNDHALALVAAGNEACADHLKEQSDRYWSHYGQQKQMFDRGASIALKEAEEELRARTPDDATAALERVKQEAFQEGYEQAKAATDHALALVAAAYEDAANLHQSLWRETSAYKTDQILKRTPDDATAALERVKQEVAEQALLPILTMFGQRITGRDTASGKPVFWGDDDGDCFTPEDAIATALKARDARIRNEALREAADRARKAHERWRDELTAHEVECDATACEDISSDIESLITEGQSDGE